MDDRGYGVETRNNVNISIEDNIFYNNRHDVAGKGSDCSYTAQYNVIKSAYKNFQRFDMHGTGPNGYGETAGETIVIQYNTIQWGSDGKKHKAIKIRGIPTNSATIQYNDFKDDSEKAAIAIYDKEGNEIYDKSEHPEFKIANNNYRCQWI
jgi:hypothetical protein